MRYCHKTFAGSQCQTCCSPSGCEVACQVPGQLYRPRGGRHGPVEGGQGRGREDGHEPGPPAD